MDQLKKGQRVQASWLQTTDGSLAGFQPKFAAVQRNVTGVITHIRGGRPVDPTSVGVWIAPDDGGAEVIVDLKWIVAIL